MAVLVDVDYDGFFPTEDKVTGASAQDQSDAEIAVVGHEDEHKEVAKGHLDDMQECLDDVSPAQ